MKYPEVLKFEEFLNRSSNFDAIIDVRSPLEFEEDHIPGAINFPVLNDTERVRVGTMYKQVGTFEAKRLGAALVAKNIAQHIETQLQDQPKEWAPLIYCWRGGNRSGAMAHIFAKIGWRVAQLDGGYKTYRKFINDNIPEIACKLNFRVLCGATGNGKSRLLQMLSEIGAQVLDLEKLAAHRGSILGELPKHNQPSQKNFESQIWNQIQHFNFEKPVFIEAESKKIGNLRIPESIVKTMRQSPCIEIKLPLDQRIALLKEDYAHFVANPEALAHQLNFLVSLHGREKINRWNEMAISDSLDQLVLELLSQHYDPAYIKSIERNFQYAKTATEIYQSSISKEDFLASAQRILILN
ncbi:MAG: tRNA 2-selenouridine(34) synthase MnmH [Burkholderiales bacterium]|nr:tRNA 2-selenouridine(34) synthase MnmH [Burkholderiales bacterium]